MSLNHRMMIIIFLFPLPVLGETAKAIYCPTRITIESIGTYLNQPSFIWTAYNQEGQFFSSYPFTRLNDLPIPLALNMSLSAYNPAAKLLLCTYDVTSGAQPVTMQNRGGY